jgi:23S rRNA (adenine2503-C2)-methyltransferase
LGELAAVSEQPAYRVEQIFRWVHRFAAESPDAMSNLPKALRDRLAQTTELTTLRIDQVQQSADGTRKLRLLCRDGQAIESVLIPRDDKLTLCISSQAGCALGCRFCATATMGLKRNLSAGEIVDQVYRANGQLGVGERVSNLVLMGMGEPLANLDNVLRAIDNLCDPSGLDLSPRRITVSTVGLVPRIRELGERNARVGLAVSLHATADDLRDRLMPINRRYPLEVLMKALRDYPLPRRRRITFEYIVLAGLNDTPADVRRLPHLLEGIPAKINLLPYNPTRPDQPTLKRPGDADVESFAERLRAKGLTVTVRHSRGLDISAACGQLALAPEAVAR